MPALPWSHRRRADRSPRRANRRWRPSWACRAGFPWLVLREIGPALAAHDALRLRDKRLDDGTGDNAEDRAHESVSPVPPCLADRTAGRSADERGDHGRRALLDRYLHHLVADGAPDLLRVHLSIPFPCTEPLLTPANAGRR